MEVAAGPAGPAIATGVGLAERGGAGGEVAESTVAAIAADGIAARVVSLPCFEWFFEQDEDYRDAVIPPGVRARVSIEAGVAMPWYQLLGDAGRPVAIDHFGASADGDLLMTEYGFTVPNIVATAKESIDAAKKG